MGTHGRIPVVIGVGDIKNGSKSIEDAHEPLGLILQAIERAIQDSGISHSAAQELQSSIDSVDVVKTWTWPYPDLPGLIARKLGVQPKHTFYSENGGNSPGKLFDEAARRVSLGRSKVAVVTGGEALASQSYALLDLGAMHSIGLPVHVYPLYENGFRAHRRQSLEENNSESAQLYGSFARIAEGNPVAWSHGKPAETPQSIGTVTKRNRLICFPSCLLTSTEFASKLGIPESRWVYPLGGAGTADSNNFWERPNFYSCPSISRSLDSALDLSGLDKGDIDLYDFYSSVPQLLIPSTNSFIHCFNSCFPIVPKLACQHLGLPIIDAQKPITLLGGLTSFGGAGNNYSMHAITAMVRRLRESTGRRCNGLVLANGGVLTYQHVVVLSSQPRKDGLSYPSKNPLPDVLTDEEVPVIESNPEGKAVVETYTVEFNRDGTPYQGYVVGRLKSNNHRFIANHADDDSLNRLCSISEEVIGKTGWSIYANFSRHISIAQYVPMNHRQQPPVANHFGDRWLQKLPAKRCGWLDHPNGYISSD
ncbi:conserved hypothetical protein [Uncinocarpus reesii 1704]|uniref:Thiolase-like protein type 1 additional C-terminal domain-containing protein n=1 Tax=Uncinocarpus reesii (strain UAMH 1704) TaxID=336963 RepID=C4JHG1_UNCRE|nr:uncharacterized protein UREG_01324 [Uncinocarpus reesii 1704]EEP76475.1 conserved hypothetical protein [Uncinocarpus reesii 1704]